MSHCHWRHDKQMSLYHWQDDKQMLHCHWRHDKQMLCCHWRDDKQMLRCHWRHDKQMSRCHWRDNKQMLRCHWRDDKQMSRCHWRDDKQMLRARFYNFVPDTFYTLTKLKTCFCIKKERQSGQIIWKLPLITASICGIYSRIILYNLFSWDSPFKRNSFIWDIWSQLNLKNHEN